MARVAIQLGRESISDSITALIELVKNAYDADADGVRIRFSGLNIKPDPLEISSDQNTIIVIEDNGSGMSESQLADNWLVIGTPNKLKSVKSSSKGRILTGEKGLGRLGLDRLSELTIVRSFTKDKSFGTELVVDWHKYEDVDEVLEKINHKIYRISKKNPDSITKVPVEINSGTQLVLYGLKDNWSKDSLLDLKRELTLLVSPFAGLNDFKIELDSGLGREQIDGVINSDYMLDAAEWTLIANLDKDSNIKYTMSSTLHNKNFVLEATLWSEKFKKAKNKTPICGPLEFRMYFFPRRDVETDDLSISRSQIDEFLNSNQGLRIYRDNFRVRPYGEPNGSGDWLNLSYRRQQSPQGVAQKPLGGWRVGYNQVVGAVFISRDSNPHLTDQTNRESIVDGPGFSDLRMFALDAVSFFEFKRQEFEMERKQQTEYETAREKASELSKQSTDVVKKLGDLSTDIGKKLRQGKAPSNKEVGELIKIAKQVEKKVEITASAQKELATAADIRQSELRNQKDTLGNLASLGILTASFGHETVGASNVAVTTASDLREDLLKGLFMVSPDLRHDIEESLDAIVYSVSKIETFAKFALRNVRRDKRHRKEVSLNNVITQVFEYFGKSLDEKNIKVELDLQERLPYILAFQIDWESIIVNFITNTVWALEDKPSTDRIIRVSTKEEKGVIFFSFSDSGIGIEAGTHDQIFLPTFSTRRNEEGIIIGTGMGLAIVKGFVDAFPGGKIEVVSPCDLGGAQFNISVHSMEIVEEKANEQEEDLADR